MVGKRWVSSELLVILKTECGWWKVGLNLGAHTEMKWELFQSFCPSHLPLDSQRRQAVEGDHPAEEGHGQEAEVQGWGWDFPQLPGGGEVTAPLGEVKIMGGTWEDIPQFCGSAAVVAVVYSPTRAAITEDHRQCES